MKAVPSAGRDQQERDAVIATGRDGAGKAEAVGQLDVDTIAHAESGVDAETATELAP